MFHALAIDTNGSAGDVGVGAGILNVALKACGLTMVYLAAAEGEDSRT